MLDHSLAERGDVKDPCVADAIQCALDKRCNVAQLVDLRDDANQGMGALRGT